MQGGSTAGLFQSLTGRIAVTSEAQTQMRIPKSGILRVSFFNHVTEKMRESQALQKGQAANYLAVQMASSKS